MGNIINLSIKRPIGTIMVFLAILIISIWSISLMPVDFLPEIEVPKLTVISSYGGLPAKEIRELLTIPMEDSFSSLKGIKHINSISRDGLSIIELEFHWGTNMVLAGVETREVIDMAYLSLPSDAGKPQVLPVDPNDEAVMTIAVFPKNGDLALARRLAEREIKSRLQQSVGVGSVQVSGGLIDEIHILLDQSFIGAKGLNVSQISSALAGGNISYPAGTIEEGSIEYIVKTDGKAKSWQKLGEYFVDINQNSPPIQIKDLGSISNAYKDQHSIFQYNGEEGVLLSIRKQSKASPVTMSKEVHKKLELLEKSYGKTLDFKVIDDSSIIIEKSISDLVISAILGAVFAFVVLLIFLKNLKNSFLLIISLPISISWALLLLSLTGRSLNVMSLGGLAMGVGMLVDNAIVVMERLSRLGNKNKSLIIQETKALAGSLLGSTITSLVVFFPVLFLPGLLGSLFTDLALAVIYSLSASLFVAVTLIPVLYVLWGKSNTRSISRKTPILMGKIFKGSFRNPFKTLIAVLLISTIGILLLVKLPFMFLPSINQGYLTVKIEMPPGSSMDYMKQVSSDLSSTLAYQKWIDQIAVQIGGEADDPYYLSNSEAGPETLFARIQYRKESSDFNRLSQDLLSVIHLNIGEISIHPPRDLLSRLLGLKPGRESWLIYRLNPEETRLAGENFIKNNASNKWKILPKRRKSQVILYPDREKLAKIGMDVSSFSQSVGSSLFGSIQSSIFWDGRDVDIKVQLNRDNKNSIFKLSQLNLKSRDSKDFKLEELVEIEEQQTLPYLRRIDRKDITELIYLGKTGKEQQKSLFSQKLVSADKSLLKDNIPGIITIFSLSLLLLYLTLGTQFESFFLPLLLMLALPLGFSGIGIALFLGRSSLNLNSILGILVLMGISVNNSILLYETFKRELKNKKNSILGSIYRGTISRFRPIMMTMLTTALALIPLAINPFGTSTQSSMALAIIGGLTISTVLSLLIIPKIFYLYERKKLSK